MADDLVDVFLSHNSRDEPAAALREIHRPALRRDVPPSPWPAEVLVMRWERLYGTVADVGATARFRTGSVPLRNRRGHDDVPVETLPAMNENATQAMGTAGRLFAGQDAPGFAGALISAPSRLRSTAPIFRRITLGG